MKLILECIEVAQGIYLPDNVFRDTTMKELFQLVSRIGWLSHDIFSYEKEVMVLGTRGNIIPIFMENYNLSFESAANQAIEMVNNDIIRFGELEKNLPRFRDEVIDCNVKGYVEGMRNMVVSMVHWQQRSNRYRSSNSPFPELR